MLIIDSTFQRHRIESTMRKFHFSYGGKMKNDPFWFAAGFLFSAGVVSSTLIKQSRQALIEREMWLQKRRPALDVLACPICHSTLSVYENAGGESYRCETCQRNFPVVGGIAHFIQPQEMTGLNRKFSRAYDLLSWGYRAFSKAAFAYIGMDEETSRREIIDRLDPKGGRVLEVSIGPGINLPYLANRADVGEIFGLDISLGQLNRCREFAAHRGWNPLLQLGNAEQLPYQDNTFAGVFHIGGINFFNDKKKAIAEMIRVAQPGAHVLICDENENGVQAYERFIPNFKKSIGERRETIVPPLALIPPEMNNIRLFEVWKGWMYCIEFTKPPLE